MATNPKVKYEVDIPLFIQSLKHQIQCTQNYIEFYRSENQPSEEVFKGKEQLRQQAELLSEIEEASRCQPQS